MEKEEHVLNFRGLIKGRITVPHDRIKGISDLYKDYFSLDPVFHEGFSRRRFRMSSRLLRHIEEEVAEFDDYFSLKNDC